MADQLIIDIITDWLSLIHNFDWLSQSLCCFGRFIILIDEFTAPTKYISFAHLKLPIIFLIKGNFLNILKFLLIPPQLTILFRPEPRRLPNKLSLYQLDPLFTLTHQCPNFFPFLFAIDLCLDSGSDGLYVGS